MNIMRRANLITPLVYQGIVRRSVWQIMGEFGPLLFLGRSGSTGYDPQGPGDIYFPIEREFPGPFVVEPDHD